MPSYYFIVMYLVEVHNDAIMHHSLLTRLGAIMNIPKQKFNFIHTSKDTPHTEEEMKFVCANQNFLDVYSWKSIKVNEVYLVQLIGWSYDCETVDYPSNKLFNNHTVFYKSYTVFGGVEEMDFNNFESPKYLANDGSVWVDGVKTKMVYRFGWEKPRPEHKNVNWERDSI